MSDVTKNYTLTGFKEEVTEGTFNEPANGDYIETLEEGAKITATRETKTRNVMSGDRMRQDLRLGSKNIEVEVPMEMKAGSSEGEAPSYQKMFESFGFKNRGLSSTVTTQTGHTTSVIKISNSDISKFKKNDIVLIKEAGAYHVSPISDVDSVSTQKTITLLIPMADAPSDNVVIAKSQVLTFDRTVNKTLSGREVLEGGQVSTKMTGLRTQSIKLQNWTTEEIASWVIAMVGLSFEEKLESPALSITPSYDNSNPPVILEACLYKGSTKLTINELTLAIEQKVSMKKSTCSPNGKVNSRGTDKVKVTGTMNPYIESNSLDFVLDESEYSLFFRAYNPTIEGEFKEVVACFIPLVKTVSKERGDQEGLLTNQVSWQAVPNSESDSIVIAFI